MTSLGREFKPGQKMTIDLRGPGFSSCGGYVSGSGGDRFPTTKKLEREEIWELIASGRAKFHFVMLS